MSLPKRPSVPDPIRLQYFFIRNKDKDYNVSLISEIISELVKVQQYDAIKSKKLREILFKFLNINRNELAKPKNDLTRLGLVVPLDIYDERTYSVRERAIHSSGRASLWKLTSKAYELKNSFDNETRAKVITSAYLENTLMNEWIMQLLAYGEKIDFSLAVKVLETIVMSYIRYASTKNDIKSLENLLTVCKVNPKRVIDDTLRPLEILTSGDLVRIEDNAVRLVNVDKYIVVRRKVSVTEYLQAIAKAYLSYLKEHKLYDIIMSQPSNIGWSVPLAKVIVKVEDKVIRKLRFEEHIEFCKKLSYIYNEFEYTYQPFADGENKHVISIRKNLLKRILKNL